MKDIDFDELDRAVSSLMKDAVPGDEPETTSATNVSTTKIVLSEEAAEPSEQSKLQSNNVAAESESMSIPVLNRNTPVISSENDLLQTQEPELAEVTAQPEAASIPTLRRGRFMDVMRPTGREFRKPDLSGTASRQGVVLQPMTETVQVQEEYTPIFDDTAPVQPEAPADQLDERSMETYDALAIEDTAADATPASEDIAFNNDHDDTPSLSSPFLADAKVEKRPLGRPSDATPVLDLAAELAESVEELAQSPGVIEDSISPNKDAQLPEQPLPAELGSELLSIETSTENLPPEVHVEVAPAVEQHSGFSPQPVAAPMPARSMEVTSIQQQYKVQPQQTEEAPAGTIYDTQPLVHPADKKPGWLWIVAILAILLLGAGAGAAVYYLGLL